MVNLYRKLPEGKRKLPQVRGRSVELASIRVIGGLLEKGERSWPYCPKNSRQGAYNGRAVKYNHFEQKNIAFAEKKFLILLFCPKCGDRPYSREELIYLHLVSQ